MVFSRLIPKIKICFFAQQINSYSMYIYFISFRNIGVIYILCIWKSKFVWEGVFESIMTIYEYTQRYGDSYEMK